MEPERPFNKKFEFGRDGKLLYVQGPDNNLFETTVEQMMADFLSDVAKERSKA